MEYFDILIVFFSLVLFCYFFRDKNGLPTNWPVFGMLPTLLKNVHRIHDFFIELMKKSDLTFHFKGPWFTNMYLLVTVDPANVHHVMSKNFGNYPKGQKLKEILDVIGDGVVNSDYLVWQYHRKMTQSYLGHPKFHHFLVRKTLEKIKNGLIPVLDHVSKHAIELDLQDLFARFTFDSICNIIMDHDPKYLSVDLPRNPFSDALDDVGEVIFYRHVVPTSVWKSQRRLDIGEEKKYRKAWETLDSFVYKRIAMKKEQLSNKEEQSSKQDQKGIDEVGFDLLTSYIQQDEDHKSPVGNQNDKFLRDTVLNNIIAGRDTTGVTLSWFFYLLSKHPQVISKIKKELDNEMIDWGNIKEVNSKFVYLHGALYETLRLYPPVVFELKAVIEADILPSGHQVNPNMQIVINMYAMGRMNDIWGDDCHEFKPERWISEQGKIRHEPSYKFLAFNAGPRTCVGKNMALTQMKLIAATIIQNYVIEAVEGQDVVPDISIILRMKNGFKVRVLH